MPNLIIQQKISIIGAKSADLALALALSPTTLQESDLALFLVSAKEGIVSADLENWRLARELYIPSLVIICDLNTSDIDFDDMTAIAGKMLDPVVTPYLVLHDDLGFPTALISLESLKVFDYSSGSRTEREADPEHVELVAEFRQEYLEDLEGAGEDSFAAGLIFPALAWVEGTRIGPDQILEYLDQVPVIS